MKQTPTHAVLTLPHDPATPLRQPLSWQQTSETSWRSLDGGYLIVAQTSPDQDGDLTAYQLRGTDQVGGYGYHIDETYDLTQTMTAAVRHRYCSEHHRDRSVPEDYDADQLVRFFWPVSEGTTRGALVVTRDEDGRAVASIVGMSRAEADEDGECRFTPATWVSLTLD